MTKITILNYVTSEVDIIDFVETDISIEDWINQHYNESEISYMITEDQELTLNFRNSTQY